MSNQVVSGPDIVSRGFVYVREADELMLKIKQMARKSIDKCIEKHTMDWSEIKNTIKDDMCEFIMEGTVKKSINLAYYSRNRCIEELRNMIKSRINNHNEK